MIDVTRRELLATSAGVSALGLTGNLALLPPAKAADLREVGHYTYKIGDIEVTSIYDGIWRVEPFDGFAIGKSADEIKAALSATGQDPSFIPLEFAFTVVKSGGKTILIDAGTGDQLAPTTGLAARGGLAAAGVTPDKVDTVIISHMHRDHIYGLMEKETNVQVYPNAEILINEIEYKFWSDPASLSKMPKRRHPMAERIRATFPGWKNVSLFNGGAEVAPGIRAINSFGHSPGHTTFHIASGDDEMMMIGDALVIPILFLENLDWQLVFDLDPDFAATTRKALVQQAVADNLTIGGYHFGFPNAGKIDRDGNGYVFVPV